MTLPTPPPPPPYNVYVDFLVVPDGIADDGRLRLNVSLSPSFRPSAIRVDLVNWPAEVSTIAANLKAALADIGRSGDPNGVTLRKPSVDLTAVPPFQGVGALALWHRIFALGDPNDQQALNTGIGWLYAALKDGSVAPPPPPAGASFEMATYQYKGIARRIDELYSSVAADGLLRRAVRRSYADVGKPLPPGFRIGDLDLGAGWWRSLNRDWFDADALEDPVSRFATQGAQGTALEFRIDTEMKNNWTTFASDQWTSLLSQGTIARSNLSAADTIFQSMIAVPEFWSDGGLQDPMAGALRVEMARLRAAWGLHLTQPDPADASGAYEITPKEDAGRKFAAILSHPTLSKFLGLHVDLTASADALGAATPAYGAIAVYTGDAPTQPTATTPQTPDTTSNYVWTAYVRREAPDVVTGYFGPCGQAESVLKALQPDQPIVDGVLNLNVQIPNGGGRRFALECLNVDTTSMALAQRSGQLAQALRNGAAPAKGSTALPDTPVPGIRLIDQQADISAQQNAVRSRQFSAIVPSTKAVQVRHAEDLVEGYRVDSALAASDGAWRETGRWRSLTAKTVTYPNADDMPADYLNLANVRAFAEREHGQVRPMLATRQGTSSLTGEHTAVVAAHQTLFTWTGDSLALRARQDVAYKADINAPDNTWILDPAKDLAIDVDTDIPTSGPGRPPPLRESRAYMFGARARFANGCGVSLQHAVTRYVAKPTNGPGLALGEDDATPFTFERRAAILAPDILLSWHSPIVTDTAKNWLGETVEHLVIRTRLGNNVSSVTQRFLTPPRARFELLEQAGIFDREGSPKGAFTGAVGLEMDPKSGALPIAADGTWHFPKPPGPSGAILAPATKKEVSRGSVMVLRFNVQAPWSPYFVDPACRQTQAKFVPHGDPESEYGALSTPVPFWEKNEAPNDARPVVLELKPKHGEPDKRAIFDERDDHEFVVPEHGIFPVKLRKLTVALSVGESVDLEISTAIDPQQAIGHKYLRGGLTLLRDKVAGIQGVLRRTPTPEALQSQSPDPAHGTLTVLAALEPQVQSALSDRLTNLMSPNPAQAQGALSELLRDAAVAPAIRKRIVRLVHAVDKPLRTPKFLQASRGAADIHAVVVRGVAGPGATAAQTQWAAYIAAARCQSIDQLDWPSQEQGVTAFFVGSVDFDRTTTGRLRCDASWLEYGTDTVKRDVDGVAWVKAPAKGGGTLFSVDEIPFAGALRGAVLNLLKDDAGAPRSLFFAFKDGRARAVSLQLVATSRFTDYFAATPGGCDNAGPGLDNPAAKIWVPCTFRPPAPNIDRVMPLFRWHVHRDRWDRKVTFTRTSSLRIYLKSDWWASGEGEQLGLICATNDQALNSPFAGGVSRWGVDPTHISGGVSNALSWEQVSDPASQDDDRAVAPTIVHDVLIASEPQPTPVPFPDGDTAALSCPPPAPPVPAPTPPEVFSVVAFEPTFDPKDGLYCDVHLDPGAAYWPFIEMNLVRYQSHAVTRFRVSPSTPFVTQVLPLRTGSATLRPERKIAFDYSGFGYTKTATGASAADQALANTPLLNVKLMIAYVVHDLPWDFKGHIQWRPVLDTHGQPVELLRQKPRQAYDGQLIWEGELAAPRFDPLAHYGLLFEEVELIWIDDPAMTIDTCHATPSPHRLAERGPTLQHVIRLWRDE